MKEKTRNDYLQKPVIDVISGKNVVTKIMS